MTGVDTNVLVQLSLTNHPWNTAAVAAVNEELHAGNVLIITSSIIAEFLHVITDVRRFPEALSMTEALDWIEEFLGNASSVRIADATQASSVQTLAWLRELQLGRKRILDTEFAAVLYTAGCRRILTSNPGDFAVFRVFETVSPKVAS